MKRLSETSVVLNRAERRAFWEYQSHLDNGHDHDTSEALVRIHNPLLTEAFFLWLIATLP